MNSRGARRRVMAAGLGFVFALCTDVTGQTAASREFELLKAATALEAAGDYTGAQRALEDVLAANPGSLPGLLQIERVLLVQGRAETLVQVTERVLAVDATSALAHQVRIRALALLDRPDALMASAEAWMAATPAHEVPYREVARILQPRDLTAAIAVLERGRESVTSPDGLAIELGSAYAAAGRWRETAREWARAVGPEGRGLNAVERRLRVLPDGGARVLPALVERLSEPDATVPMLRAAAILSIGAGMGRRAAVLARRTAAGMEGRPRMAFLTEIARRADGAGLSDVAYFAYDALDVGARDDGTARWAVRARLADLALIVGDTARAADIYRSMERAFDRGSPERRDAMSMRVRLAARDGDPQGARKALTGFRTEFPGSPELDAAAAEVAAAYLRTGDATMAHAVIDGIAGPYTTRMRALLALGEGDLASARTHLLRAVPGLRGEAATEAIALAALLLRLSPAGGEIVARMVASGLPSPHSMDALATDANDLARGERAAILDFAAESAESAGDAEEARALRRTLLDEHPDAPETPAALLALARALSTETGGEEEARILLARLVVDYPRSALVPQARRELERLGAVGAAR